jgi:hypothetical protein
LKRSGHDPMALPKMWHNNPHIRPTHPTTHLRPQLPVRTQQNSRNDTQQ